jgi:hypothetical protein
LSVLPDATGVKRSSLKTLWLIVVVVGASRGAGIAGRAIAAGLIVTPDYRIDSGMVPNRAAAPKSKAETIGALADRICASF